MLRYLMQIGTRLYYSGNIVASPPGLELGEADLPIVIAVDDDARRFDFCGAKLCSQRLQKGSIGDVRHLC